MAEVTFKKICLSCKTWDKIPNMIFWEKDEELYTDSNQQKVISLSTMNGLLGSWHYDTTTCCNHCDNPGPFRFNEVKINGVLVEGNNHMKSSFTVLGLKDMRGQITLPPTGEEQTPNEIFAGLSMIKNELERNWAKKQINSKPTGFFEFKIEFDRKNETSSLTANHIDGFSYQEISHLFGQIQNYYQKSLEQHRQKWTGESSNDDPF